MFWLDQSKAVKRLRKAAQDLARFHPEIEHVILFGSLARQEAVPGSDADLLLILTESDLPFLERGLHYHPGDVGIGVDVFAYTRSEVDVMQAAGNEFFRQALREGMTLVGGEITQTADDRRQQAIQEEASKEIKRRFLFPKVTFCLTEHIGACYL